MNKFQALKLLGTCSFILLLVFNIVNSTRPFKKNENENNKISLNGKWFVDTNGRVVLFRGINAVRKSFPWLPDASHTNMMNESQLINLKNWGFNCVRLGLMWSGLMPTKNQINSTYLTEIKNIINNLNAHNIYVIIDLHQDMISSKFNSYDGAPLWAIEELPNSKKPYPWPFKNGDKLVFEAYATEACGFAFQCYYFNYYYSYFGYRYKYFLLI